MTIKHQMRKILWHFGYDICRTTPKNNPLVRRKKFLERYDVNVVLDIGANAGRFARETRTQCGYTEKIISFEPLSSAFHDLVMNAKGDEKWITYNCALGDVDEEQEINIAGNSDSSSLLEMLPAHIEAAPKSTYVGKERIKVCRLDSLFNELCQEEDRIYMKIDTQGFEMNVLRGAEKVLPSIDTIQMEMSLVPLYNGQVLFNEMCSYMGRLGYHLISLENGFSDTASGQLLQVDGIFHNDR